MYNYSTQIEGFRMDKVRLSTEFKDKLYAHRDANRARIITRLPEKIEGLTISSSNFKPQGSMANYTIIQTTFVYDEYDIDDGVILNRSELINEEGNELSAEEVRAELLSSLKDKRFSKQPTQVHNCIRVFYKEEDEERHHVDFPVYRKFENENGDTVQELAGGEGWMQSDPTQVNRWFLEEVIRLNQINSGWGTQFRRLVQLIKRFGRSRKNWDLPNGMKLTMLVHECLPNYCNRIDLAFRELLEAIDERLKLNKQIFNLAHPDQPALTRGISDHNIVELEERVQEALEQLEELDKNENNDAARKAWDWIFRSDGYFKNFDDKEAEKAKEASLRNKVDQLSSGCGKTSSLGVIGSVGVANTAHSFYGDR